MHTVTGTLLIFRLTFRNSGLPAHEGPGRPNAQLGKLDVTKALQQPEYNAKGVSIVASACEGTNLPTTQGELRSRSRWRNLCTTLTLTVLTPTTRRCTYAYVEGHHQAVITEFCTAAFRGSSFGILAR